MTAFAQTLQRQQQEAAAIQTSERTKRRVVRRSPVVVEPSEPAESPDDVFDDEHHEPGAFAMAGSPKTEQPALPATVTPSTQPSSTELGPLHDTATSTAISVSPLDLPTEFFSAGLDRRKRNRALLMEWLRTALVDGVDFGRIHIAGKDRCQLVRMGRVHECKDPGHWSKPALFKAGAEKITGMLGMTVHYPTLPAYEDAFLAQADIRTIMLRCELRDAHGHVVAQGAGARHISQDYGDLNKTSPGQAAALAQDKKQTAPLFTLGAVLITPGALDMLEALQLAPLPFILRHVAGDWGDLCTEDKQANAAALTYGSRLLSAYDIPPNHRLWIITEADRRSTTLLLPEEY